MTLLRPLALSLNRALLLSSLRLRTHSKFGKNIFCTWSIQDANIHRTLRLMVLPFSREKQFHKLSTDHPWFPPFSKGGIGRQNHSTGGSFSIHEKGYMSRVMTNYGRFSQRASNTIFIESAMALSSMATPRRGTL